MRNMEENLKPWAYFVERDELRYYGRGKNAFIHVDIGDVELIIDEDGEIVDLAIYNASKYIDKKDIEKISVKYIIAELMKKKPLTK